MQSIIKILSGVIFSLLVLQLSCTLPGSAISVSASNKDAEIIKQLEYEAISAEFKLDTASIARVLHDNFIAVYANKLGKTTPLTTKNNLG